MLGSSVVHRVSWCPQCHCASLCGLVDGAAPARGVAQDAVQQTKKPVSFPSGLKTDAFRLPTRRELGAPVGSTVCPLLLMRAPGQPITRTMVHPAVVTASGKGRILWRCPKRPLDGTEHYRSGVPALLPTFKLSHENRVRVEGAASMNSSR